MAGDWIKIRTNLHDDPRIIRMAADLKRHELHVVGMLYRLWAWVDGQSIDANDLGINGAFLDRLTDCRGFCDALRAAGWLEGDDMHLRLPRFEEHNGVTAKARAVNARRVTQFRQKANKCNGATVTPTVTNGDTRPLTSALTREEKRREDTLLPTLHSISDASAGGPEPRAGGEDEEVNSSIDDGSEGGSDPAPRELQDVEAVWAVYPKRVGTLEGKLAIRAAIRRDGLQVVLAGTRAVAEADARRNGSAAVGRYLPKPAEFFDGSRYLDDPAQYGPKSPAGDPETLRKQVAELQARVAEHPGNPENTVGSLERKKAAAGEFKELKSVLAAKRRELSGMTKEVEP